MNNVSIDINWINGISLEKHCDQANGRATFYLKFETEYEWSDCPETVAFALTPNAASVAKFGRIAAFIAAINAEPDEANADIPMPAQDREQLIAIGSLMPVADAPEPPASDALRETLERVNEALNDNRIGYAMALIDDALKSAPSHLPSPAGWRDIASAPSAKNVLVAYKNRCDKWRVVKAVRYEQYQNEQPADDDEGECGEYCEEKDAYFVRAGWYELIDNWDDFGFVSIYEGEPVAWQHLPAAPKGRDE